MNDERRRLLLARETWRSMHPSEMDVLRAAKRIATKFSPRKGFSFGRRVRMVSGALATIAGIAYAGSGGWTELTGRFGHGSGGRTVAEEQVAASSARSAGQPLRATGQSLRSTGPHEPKEDRPGQKPEHLAIDEPVAVPADSASKASKKKPPRSAVAHVRRSGGGGDQLTASVDRVDPTWADVNAALGELDYRRAETLLLQLADGWHDADTRAKAHLGLAQLAAARGDCERARVLALNVAAVPGIEMKTVRRALELAVRCAR